MSEIFDNGYRDGEASNGKDKMSPFDASQFKDEYMAGYCLARGEYQGAGTQMFYYSLGLHAGFYSLPKGPFKKLYDSSLDYDGRFDSGYEEGLEERDDWFKDNE
ncbi:hypothetical protein [Enterobacter roggenkampii]|uniref:hypothetical protein n=1 Tax=Enterobacter roggenkampii TaxID=1812935 RepID=UPI001896FD78|nr:hypothetical protein [Enterobacter roggenkampii]HCN5210849.1 hypothetical protein [Escherichia coli]